MSHSLLPICLNDPLPALVLRADLLSCVFARPWGTCKGGRLGLEWAERSSHTVQLERRDELLGICVHGRLHVRRDRERNRRERHESMDAVLNPDVAQLLVL